MTPGAAPPPPAPVVEPTENDLTEQYGVFVTEKGADSGDGSRKQPFATISKAIATAKSQGKRVYVCKGRYAEALVLLDGISIIGGLDCSQADAWMPTTGRSVVAAPTSPALRAEDIKTATRIDRLDVQAPDATEASTSSYGLVAKNAPALVFANTRIAAGRGADGTAGVEPPAQGSPPASATGIRGQPSALNSNVNGAGAAGGTNPSCGGDAGGKGGDSGIWKVIPPDNIEDPNYKWAIYVNPGNPPAKSGAAGARGTDGASAESWGTFQDGAFVPQNGTLGTNGGAGTGGRGGMWAEPSVNANDHKNELWIGYAGSGGGAGGCGGVAGTPGTGGGASIAALLVASPIRFEKSELVGGNGGRGGRGTLGSIPMSGGSGGPASGPAETAGKNGGSGGPPGVSGSGAGGPSLGIAHSGAAPTLVESSAKPGVAGSGVAAVAFTDPFGNNQTLPASVDGAATSIYAF